MGLESVIGAGLGIGTGVMEGNIQNHFNQQNQAMQIAGQKEMGKYNQGLALEMWDKTNYEAQRKHMEAAGLNVGLMYGKGGGGGATTSTPTGNVGTQTTKVDTTKGMGMQLQNEAIQSQIDVNKSDVVKKNAETEEIKARTPTYEKSMQKTDSEIQEIATKMGVNVETVKRIMQDVEESKSRVPVNEMTVLKGGNEINKIQAETSRMKQMTPHEVQKIEQEVIAETIRNKYLEPKEKAEVEKLVNESTKILTELVLKGQEIQIQTFKAEMEAKYPNIMNVVGSMIDNIKKNVLQYTGENKNVDYKVNK